jgi:hypothetical protein
MTSAGHRWLKFFFKIDRYCRPKTKNNNYEYVDVRYLDSERTLLDVTSKNLII